MKNAIVFVIEPPEENLWLALSYIHIAKRQLHGLFPKCPQAEGQFKFIDAIYNLLVAEENQQWPIRLASWELISFPVGDRFYYAFLRTGFPFMEMLDDTANVLWLTYDPATKSCRVDNSGTLAGIVSLKHHFLSRWNNRRWYR